MPVGINIVYRRRCERGWNICNGAENIQHEEAHFALNVLCIFLRLENYFPRTIYYAASK